MKNERRSERRSFERRSPNPCLYEFSQALTIQCKNVSCKECVAGPSTKWYLSEAATVRNESVATFFAPFEAAAVVCQHG